MCSFSVVNDDQRNCSNCSNLRLISTLFLLQNILNSELCSLKCVLFNDFNEKQNNILLKSQLKQFLNSTKKSNGSKTKRGDL